MTSLVEKILNCHQALSDNDIPHGFGGALALAWCTRAARGTIDIDINIFTGVEQAQPVLDALPVAVKHSTKDRKKLIQETQVRLWWDATPVDLFLNSTPFHDEVRSRLSWETFSGQNLPFLCCQDLAVFKAFFNRTKDWADIEEMHAAGTLDIRFVTSVLTQYLGADDMRLTRLYALTENKT